VIALSEQSPIHDTLRLVSSRFSIETLFALADERLRYKDLMPAITLAAREPVHPSTVSDTLRKLQDTGLLVHPAHDEATYRLTPKGRDLVGLLRQVKAWGDAHQQAARRMGVSKTTVDTYVRRIRTGRVVRPGPAGPSGIGPASAVERP
jgi:DNA-binding HxlR family transcriptional regulator